MPLERTHNIDGNGPRATGTTLYTAPGEERVVAMGIADADAIYSMLSDLSANKGAYVLREAYSNAHDATMRAGDMSLPIEVDLTDAHGTDTSNLVTKLASSTERERTLTVTDHGTGMSANEIACNFLQYGGSDKRDEADSIGSKGLGSKAPLAVTESFVVTSTKDGMTTTAIVERTPKKAGQGRLVTKRTDAPNGTTVQIPVPDAITFGQMQQFLATLRTYNTDANLIINGSPAKRALPDGHGDFTKPYVYVGEANVGEDGQCPVRIWEANRKKGKFSSATWPIMGSMSSNVSLAVVIGGVPYTLDGHNVSTGDNGDPLESFIVELQPGWLDFTPSRDEIKQNAAAQQMQTALIQALRDIDYSDDLSHLLCDDDSAFVKFLASTKLRDPNAYGYGYGYGYGYNRIIPDYQVNFVADVQEDESVHIVRHDHRRGRRLSDEPKGATLTATTLDEDGNGGNRMSLITRSTTRAAHVLVTEPLSANANQLDIKRTMDLDGKRIVKGRMSQVAMAGHEKPDDFVDLLVSELAEDGAKTIVVTGISNDEGLRRMMRLENDYRMSDPATSPQTTHMSYVLCTELEDLDDEVAWLIRRLGLKTVSIDDVEAKAKERRKAVNRAKRRERLAMESGDRERPLPSIQHSWTTKNVPVAKIEDAHSVTWYLIATMKTSYPYNNAIPYTTKALHTLVRDSQEGMSNLAIVASDADDYDLRKQTTQWAARLSALKTAGNFPLDPKVDSVIGLPKNTPTGLIRGLMARGASIVCDNRTNVKVPIEDTLVNRRPDIVDCLGRMSTPLLFGTDDPEPAIWTVLSDELAGQIMAKSHATGTLAMCEAKIAHSTNVSLARLTHDLLEGADVSEGLRTKVLEPLAILFSRRDTERDEEDRPYRYRGAGSAHYRRRYEDDVQIIIPDSEHPAPRLKDIPELAMRMETAVDLAAQASRFMALPWMTDQPRASIGYMAFPGSEAIDEMRPLIAPLIAERLEELVRESEAVSPNGGDDGHDADRNVKSC